MTENANGTYNNEACTKNSTKDKSLQEIVYEITEDELSRFPDDTVPVEQLKRMAENQSLRRKRRRKKIIAAAAVFFVALAGILIGFSDFPANVEADKNEPEEIVTEDGVVIEDGGWGSSSEDELIITDWDEITETKCHLEELIIPRFIPDGYCFDKLVIGNEGSDDIKCEYLFVNGNQEIMIHQFIHFNSYNSFYQEEYDEIVECKKGKIYLNNIDKNTIATIIVSGGCIVKIWGVNDKGTIVNIVDGLEY